MALSHRGASFYERGHLNRKDHNPARNWPAFRHMLGLKIGSGSCRSSDCFGEYAAETIWGACGSLEDGCCQYDNLPPEGFESR